MKAAAALIRSEIDAVKGNVDTYPDISSLGDKGKHENDVPSCLLLLLTEIFRRKQTDTTLKITSIGHCIMQLARPRSLMSSLLFGLTMELHWEFGSMDLIHKLFEKGLCLSYDEVLLFKASAAKHQSESFSNLQGSFCHVIADNVDHNTITIDGRGTYHGMGLMYTATPAYKNTLQVYRYYHFRSWGNVVRILFMSTSKILLQKMKHDTLISYGRYRILSELDQSGRASCK